MPDYKQVLFRVTWDVYCDDGRVVPQSDTCESLTKLWQLLEGLAMKPDRYSNVKKYAARIDWIEI